MYSFPTYFFSPTNLILDIVDFIVFILPFAVFGYVVYRAFKKDDKKK